MAPHLTSTKSLGSIEALALANPATTLMTVGITGGVILTAGTALWVYHLIKEKKEQELLAEIKRIIKLHQNHLKKIHVTGSVIAGFPEIFKITKDKEIECIHVPDEIIKGYGKHVHEQSDVILAKYRLNVIFAIWKLQDFYFDSSEKDIALRGVIVYSLQMLDTKLLHFAGFRYDLAYLKAFVEFLNQYASLDKHGLFKKFKDPEETKNFSRLSEVYVYLNKAIDELEAHQKLMSLKDIVDDLNATSTDGSMSLIKLFAQLITPKDHWDHIPTATHDEMKAGILRKEYIEHNYLLFKTHDSEVKMLDTIFRRDWHKWLLEFFDEGIDPNSPITIDDILKPEEKFKLPDLAKLDKSSNASSAEKAAVRKQLKEIESLFSTCDNFMTRKLGPADGNKTPRYVAITEPTELVDRSHLLFLLASLIHRTISIQYLCVYLSKSLKQLGEIYVKNPKHYGLIFHVFQQLCQQTKENAEAVNDFIDKIQKSNHHTMRIAEQESLPNEIKNLLTSTLDLLLDANTRLKEFRDNSAKKPLSITQEGNIIRQEIAAVAQKLADVYGISTEEFKPTPNNSGRESPTPQPTPRLPENEMKASNENNLNEEQQKKSFWQKHKKHFKWFMGGTALLGIGAAVILSVLSAGTLSPFAALMGALGAKVAINGFALACFDAGLGFFAGIATGGLISGMILAGNALKNKISSVFKSKNSKTTDNENSAPVKSTNANVKLALVKKDHHPKTPAPINDNPLATPRKKRGKIRRRKKHHAGVVAHDGETPIMTEHGHHLHGRARRHHHDIDASAHHAMRPVHS